MSYIYTNKHGTSYAYPETLVFKRKTGSTYIHIGRAIEGFPTYSATDTIKSVETGKIKVMSEKELIEFKKG